WNRDSDVTEAGNTTRLPRESWRSAWAAGETTGASRTSGATESKTKRTAHTETIALLGLYARTKTAIDEEGFVGVRLIFLCAGHGSGVGFRRGIGILHEIEILKCAAAPGATTLELASARRLRCCA